MDSVGYIKMLNKTKSKLEITTNHTTNKICRRSWDNKSHLKHCVLEQLSSIFDNMIESFDIFRLREFSNANDSLNNKSAASNAEDVSAPVRS